MKLTDEEILKACDSTKWIAPEELALDIGRAIEAAVLAQGEPVNTALLERITKLEQALDVALEALEWAYNGYEEGLPIQVAIQSAINLLKEERRD